jgi:hypothetical protein
MKKTEFLLRSAFLVPLAISIIIQNRLLYAEETLLGKSADLKPVWLNTPWTEHDGKLFVVGIKTNAKTLEDGEKDARYNAIEKICETFFGIKGKITYEKIKNNLETGYNSKSKISTKGEIFGISVESIYWEKWRRIKNKELVVLFDVWVLVKGESEQIKNSAESLNEKTNLVRKNAGEKLDVCMEYYTQGKIGDLLNEISTIEKTLNCDEVDPECLYVLNEFLSLKKQGVSTLTLTKLKPKYAEDGKYVYSGVSVASKGKKQPGIPVTFAFKKGGGELKGSSVTDQNGEAWVTIKIQNPLLPSTIEARIDESRAELIEIPGIGEKYYIVVAINQKIDSFSGSNDNFNSYIASKISEYGFHSRIIKVSDGLMHDFKSGSLKNDYFKPSEVNDTYLLYCKLQTTSANYAGSLIFHKIKVDFELYSMNSRSLLFSKDFEAKGGGVTILQAGEKAIKTLIGNIDDFVKHAPETIFSQ